MESHLKAASVFAYLLDARFKFFKFRFGIASLIDLIPGFGDILAATLSLYLIWIAVQMHAPPVVLSKMFMNVLISFVIGLLPVVGDVGYILYRPNLKNLALLKEFSKKKAVEGTVL